MSGGASGHCDRQCRPKEFTFAKAITRQKFKPLMLLTSFARDTKTESQVAGLITLLHGGKKTLK